jgi:RsiW-degrading membrane proteinase PrsW (M82 family)
VTAAQAPKKKKASLLQVATAVFWSFLGIRKRRDYETDSVELKPQQVIVAGLIGAAFLVLSLILLVRFVIGRLV